MASTGTVRELRVVHVVTAAFGLDGVIGGAERYALELARHMADHTPTTLVTFGERERREKIGNLEIRVIGDPWYVRGQRNNPVAPALLSELCNADVVHCHQHHVLASSIAAVFCRLTGRRVFVTDLGGGGWDVSAFVSTDRWYHGHLHISEYSLKCYSHAGKSFAHVIMGGVDTEKFSPAEGGARDSKAIFVGRILPHKGVDDLVRAVPGDLSLEVIGQPYDATYLERLKQLAAGKRVIFRHDCDDAALVDAYRSALCVVLPSVYRSADGSTTLVPELLGQTLLEAMACGTPAICTSVGAMPEIVEDGETGFVVAPSDPAALGRKIGWLAANREEAARMGAAARMRVLEKFVWPEVVRRCLEIYRGRPRDRPADGARDRVEPGSRDSR